MDSFGNYKLVVKLYQTHQPCFIDIPGYYGLMYLSPGDSVCVTVDNAARWANRHLGKEGSVLFVGGTDNDVNNMLASNESHKVIWNTWCGACLAAMADHEQEKGDYTDKVAFVYLADETSPEALWNERIKAFTGDHYRLPLDQHQSLMQRFNFQGYPSYIIINSNGDIVFTTHHIHSLSELDEWLK